jgi:hypothetical protein
LTEGLNVAIDVNTAKANIKAAIKTQAVSLWGHNESDYEEFATLLSDAIGLALQTVKETADVTGVISGFETVPGGVD